MLGSRPTERGSGPHVVSNRHKYAPKEAEILQQNQVRIDFVGVGKEAVPGTY